MLSMMSTVHTIQVPPSTQPARWRGVPAALARQ
jgi:hypothetical protein